MSEPAKGKKKSWRKWMIPVTTGVIVVLLGVGAILLKGGTSETVDTPGSTQPTPVQQNDQISLPSPTLKSSTSLEAALKSRRTRRVFLDEQLDLKTVSQMLWAGQGVTADWGGRTTPSAKSTYPLKLYLVVNNVEGLEPGQYEYVPGDRTPAHLLTPVKKATLGKAIFTALNQNSYKDVPAMIVITGDMTKMATAYGGEAHDKDVYLEAGHAAQNLYLEAESLKIGMVTNSSFNDSTIRNIITIPEGETLIYLIPFGKPKD